MHNSLFTRDLLLHTNNDPLRTERRDPHRALVPLCRLSETDSLAYRWSVSCDEEPSIAAAVVGDLTDFLNKMGATVEAEAPNKLHCCVDAALAPRALELRCTEGRIEVAGGDAAGLWAGIAWLEWEMRTRNTFALPTGTIKREAAWRWQISQGAWGANYSVPDFSPEYLGDDGFRLFAHYGVNSTMIYGDLMCYVQSSIFPELNHPEAAHHYTMLKDAARRAAVYGVQFSYVVVGPKLEPGHPLFARLPETRGTGTDDGGVAHCLCSSNQQVLDFYAEFFEQLFTEVPELAGIILIIGGESFYHCRMHISRHNALPCPRCIDTTNEANIAKFMTVIEAAVHRAQPAAFVTPWAYNVDGWEHPDRAELIRALPKGMPYYHHIEKDQYYKKDGYTKRIWDYSIDFTGPSDSMNIVAAECAKGGRELFVKTETSIGLEVIQFPYLPAMQQLADKWQQVRDLKPAAVQQSWLFFGMCGARTEELGLWAAYAPDIPCEDFLFRIAERDFDCVIGGRVHACWSYLSEAVRHIPCVTLTYYYIGPSFLGPAHPLIPSRETPVPEVFSASLFYLQELNATFSRSSVDTPVSLVMSDLPSTTGAIYVQADDGSDGWDIVLREYRLAAAAALKAWDAMGLVESGLCDLPQHDINLREEAMLVELFYRTMETCANTVEFLMARRDLENGVNTEAREAAEATMRRLAKVEKENALAAIPIYREARWLDACVRSDGNFSSSIAMIEDKVRLIDRFLAGE